MIRILYLRTASLLPTPKYNGIHFYEQYNNSYVSASHVKPSIWEIYESTRKCTQRENGTDVAELLATKGVRDRAR